MPKLIPQTIIIGAPFGNIHAQMNSPKPFFKPHVSVLWTMVSLNHVDHKFGTAGFMHIFHTTCSNLIVVAETDSRDRHSMDDHLSTATVEIRQLW